MIARSASLRTRLVLGATTVVLVFVVVFGLGAAWVLRRAEDQAVAAALQSRMELARDEVTSAGTLSRDAGSPKTDLVQVIGPDGTVRDASTAMRRLGPLVAVADVPSDGKGLRRDAVLQQPDVDLAVLAVPIRLRASDRSPAGTGALVVGVDSEGFTTAATQLRWTVVAGLGAVVLAVGALAWVLIGRALRSVTRLTESAERVGAGDLAAGLPAPTHDAELGRLVGALNRMLARLDESHTAELAFAADAGHRLRTPVATLRAEAELALREPDAAARTVALEHIVQDADQLTSIVDRMLVRTRNHTPSSESVARTIEMAAERWTRHARLADVRAEIVIDPTVTPTTSCAVLLEVVEPVLDNAVRHTPPGGLVGLRVSSDDRRVLIEVTNSGAGVPEDLVDRVFEPWVSSRDASTAGGLGLWLARETARDAGGDVVLRDPGPPQCTFRIQLPLVEDEDPATRARPSVAARTPAGRGRRRGRAGSRSR